MILVEHISIITESVGFVLLFQTQNGHFSQSITNFFAQQLQLILDDQKTLHGSLLNESDMQLNYCQLFYQDTILTANLISTEKNFIGMWQEGLLIALELKSPIFLDDQLLVNDYQIGDVDHELLVEELIAQEERYDHSHQVKKMVQNMMQAVSDERYEDAAVLRDQLQQLKDQ